MVGFFRLIIAATMNVHAASWFLLHRQPWSNQGCFRNHLFHHEQRLENLRCRVKAGGDHVCASVLDYGGKRSATPLSHARNVFASTTRHVRPKAPSPLPLCRRSPY